jgi:hypothetical protein
MTQFPDDERLIEFLRQYRPEVPPAKPNLEQQILQSLEAAPPSARPSLRIIKPTIAKLATGMAAGMLLVLGGYRLLSPAFVDTASLETFMVNNWDGIIGEIPETSTSDNTEAEWMLLADVNTASP